MPRARSSGWFEEAERAEPVVDRHDHHVAAPREPRAVVEEGRAACPSRTRRRGSRPSPAGARASARRRPHVEREAVLRLAVGRHADQAAHDPRRRHELRRGGAEMGRRAHARPRIRRLRRPVRALVRPAAARTGCRGTRPCRDRFAAHPARGDLRARVHHERSRALRRDRNRDGVTPSARRRAPPPSTRRTRRSARALAAIHSSTIRVPPGHSSPRSVTCSRARATCPSAARARAHRRPPGRARSAARRAPARRSPPSSPACARRSESPAPPRDQRVHLVDRDQLRRVPDRTAPPDPDQRARRGARSRAARRGRPREDLRAFGHAREHREQHEQERREAARAEPRHQPAGRQSIRVGASTAR